MWEVLLLCGYLGIKGVGSYLIDTLETICEMNGIKKLILESVFDAVDFYKKKGFRTKDGLEMEKMV
jgi:GNAT superfamily N-acetyltransferase